MQGYQALFYRFANPSYRFFQLIKAGVSPNVLDKNGASPLCVAFSRNRKIEAGILLENKADDVYAFNRYASPMFSLYNENPEIFSKQARLMIASSLNLEKEVFSLVQEGVSLNITNRWGESPLMIASYNGNLDLVRFMKEYGAFPDLMTHAGRTAFLISVQKKEYKIVEFLLPYASKEEIQKACRIAKCTKDAKLKSILRRPAFYPLLKFLRNFSQTVF